MYICIRGYKFCISTKNLSQTSVKFLSLPGESFESTVHNSTTISSQILTYTSFMATSTTEFYNITPNVDIKPLNGQHISHIYTTHVSSLRHVILQKICLREKRKSCLYVQEVPNNHSWCS